LAPTWLCQLRLRSLDALRAPDKIVPIEWIEISFKDIDTTSKEFFLAALMAVNIPP
jgi:hypothetical protein